jgi:hypothetical protein
MPPCSPIPYLRQRGDQASAGPAQGRRAVGEVRRSQSHQPRNAWAASSREATPAVSSIASVEDSIGAACGYTAARGRRQRARACLTGLILCPWGDDQNQTDNAAMGFLNPTFDGLRGIKNDSYKEHILREDWRWYEETAARMRDGAFEDLYGAAGNRPLRHLGNLGRLPLHAAPSDHPPKDPQHVARDRLSRGRPLPANRKRGQDRPKRRGVLITEFCLALMCAGDAVLAWAAAGNRLASQLRELRETLRETPAGRRYVKWTESLADEIVGKLMSPALAPEGAVLLKGFGRWWSRRDGPLGDRPSARPSMLRSATSNGSADDPPPKR